MATIIDVAKMAGVSQGTASNVLNGKENVSTFVVMGASGWITQLVIRKGKEAKK